MPQRFLRPGITNSDAWNSVSFGAQSFYVRILTLVDDYGRYDGRVPVLHAHCFALCPKVRQQDTFAFRTELFKAGLVMLYENGGKEFLQVSKWQERARGPSKYPEPPQESAADGSGTQPNPASLAIVPSHESSPSPKPSPAYLPPVKKPSIEEVRSCCFKTGLPESDADWFWNKAEGNGWTNGGKAIKSWTHTIAAWKAAGYFPSQKKQQFSDRPKSPNDLRTIIQAKETKAAQMRTRYCSDTAIDSVWNDMSKKREFFDLKREIKTLTDQLSNMA